MPTKPLMGLSGTSLSRFRKTKPKTRNQKAAKTQAEIRLTREKNLAKARKVLKKKRKEAKK